MRGHDELQRWAGSGALALTGPPDARPLGPPEGFVPQLDALATSLTKRSVAIGHRVDLDGLAVLTERAALLGLWRGGRTSCGGATRLLPAADGWIAVTLARDDDIDLLPAWLGTDPVDGDPWPVVGDATRARSAEAVVGRGAELGLAVAHLPDPQPAEPAPTAHGIVTEHLGDADRVTSLEGVVVVDLSSLWAGPLATSVLADAGATVVKVESTQRPDGARAGSAAFFDLCNAGKWSIALDFSDDTDRQHLRALVQAADVVVEASRPRALAQLGIDTHDTVRRHTPRIWLSITGHGRSTAAAQRVGFGDDAAVAGGLVAWAEHGPCFCLDAVADPLTGLTAADAVLGLLAQGGRWIVDACLARVAASFAGPTIPVPDELDAFPPSATRRRGSAPELGADTGVVLRNLGVVP